MSKKQKNKPEGVVYSTNPDFEFNYNEEKEPETLPPGEQKLKVVLDTKSRAGKTVTLIKGFVGTSADIEDLGKSLKTFLGTGGSVKNSEIIIQGDHRQKTVDFLMKKGFKVVK